MKQILLIGIGQTGSTVAESFLNKLNNGDTVGTALAIDTDRRSLANIFAAKKIYLTDTQTLSDVVEAIDADTVRSYFPCDWENDGSVHLKGLDMQNGANLWRMKAFLSFNSFLADEVRSNTLHSSLDSFVANCNDEDEIELYTVASLAGGTGSGLFLPIVLYVKKYLEGCGKKIYASKAFLAMPDVYKSVFSAEQAEKTYANAYAALRELNAVNNIALSGNGQEQSFSQRINFRLNVSNKFGTLFDSEDEQFAVPSVAPFDKVVLFDAIPTISSVSEHIAVITDAVLFDCDEKKSDSEEKEVSISCQSIIRLEYPLHSILDYIAKQQLHTFASQEIGKVKVFVDNRLYAKLMNAKNEHRSSQMSFEAYRDCYISSVEDMLDEAGGFSEKLIGRDVDNNVKLESAPNLYDFSWEDALEQTVEACAQNDGFEGLKKLISDEAKRESDESKKSRDMEFLTFELVFAARKNLSDAFLNAQTALKESTKNFVSEIMHSNEGDVFSIERDILSDNGSFVHPIYALFKLCVAHKNLDRYKDDSCIFECEMDESCSLPLELMYIEGNTEAGKKAKKSRYVKRGERRFIELLSRESYEENIQLTKKTKKDRNFILDDRKTFFYDLESVYNKLLSSVKNCYYRIVADVLEKLIGRYKALLDRLYKASEAINEEVSLALISGTSSNATVLSLGASAEEKEYLYAKYIAEFEKNTTASDNQIAEIIASFACSDLSDDEISGNDLRELLAKVEYVYKSSITHTDFYKSELDKTVFDIIGISSEKESSERSFAFSQMLTERYRPLGMKIAPGDKRRHKISEGIKLVFSESLKEDSRVDEVLSAFANSETNIRFVNNMSDKEMAVCRETIDFPLDFVEFFNEASRDRNGYTAYRDSLDKFAFYQTPMWNPKLLYNRDGRDDLPFISPKKQKDYEIMTAKAVIYAFLEKIIFSSANDKKQKVYFVKKDYGVQPISMYGREVKNTDIDTVMLWAYGNTAWTETYAAQYLEHIDAYTLEELWKIMLTMVLEIDKHHSVFGDICIDLLVQSVNETFLGRYTDKNGDIEEKNAVIYRKKLSECFAYACEKLGTDMAQSYAKRFNSKGFFLDYSYFDKFYDFDFQKIINSK